MSETSTEPVMEDASQVTVEGPDGWLQGAQSRVRDFVTAEGRLMQTLREMRDAGISLKESREWLEAVAGRVSAQSIWNRLSLAEKAVEGMIDERVQRLVQALGLVQLPKLEAEVSKRKKLKRRMKALEKRIRRLESKRK